jgi:hypothetical protein
MARAIGRKKILVTLTDAATNYPISTGTLITSDFEVYVPVGNGGPCVYIGDSTLDATWIPRTSGSRVNYVSGDGSMAGPSAPLAFDLSKFYVRGSVAGDTVIVEYAAFTNI